MSIFRKILSTVVTVNNFLKSSKTSLTRKKNQSLEKVKGLNTLMRKGTGTVGMPEADKAGGTHDEQEGKMGCSCGFKWVSQLMDKLCPPQIHMLKF